MNFSIQEEGKEKHSNSHSKKLKLQREFYLPIFGKFSKEKSQNSSENLTETFSCFKRKKMKNFVQSTEKNSHLFNKEKKRFGISPTVFLNQIAKK